MSLPCIHGQLARQCPMCEAQNDHASAMEMIERLLAEIAEARQGIHKLREALSANNDACHDEVHRLATYTTRAIERMNELEAELAEARRESEALRADAWQPIETAPKDGSLILLRSPKGRIADGFWGHYGVWAWPYVMVEPTEWRPLPISAARAGGGHE